MKRKEKTRGTVVKAVQDRSRHKLTNYNILFMCMRRKKSAANFNSPLYIET